MQLTRHRSRTGSASDRGRRRHAADALAVHDNPDGLGIAVADGIGDSAEAAAAARAAADTAASLAAHEGAVTALLAAGEAVRARPATRVRWPATATRGDAVMVVAAVWPGRCEVAWVGDCRAYLVDGTGLRRLSTDQTAAQAVRSAGGTPPQNWENVVLETVGGATAGTLGHQEVPATAGRLVLVTDGVHHELSDDQIAAMVARAPDCASAARLLTDTALLGGAGDNASATVVDLPIGPARSRPVGSTTPNLPAVTPAPVAETA